MIIEAELAKSLKISDDISGLNKQELTVKILEAQAEKDGSVFARGISIALYNTAGGIVVAVPAMIAFRYFRSKVDHLVNEMEQQALHLVETMRGERK